MFLAHAACMHVWRRDTLTSPFPIRALECYIVTMTNPLSPTAGALSRLMLASVVLAVVWLAVAWAMA